MTESQLFLVLGMFALSMANISHPTLLGILAWLFIAYAGWGRHEL
jgi:hypothetical protein